jgi:hypothetical protein
LAVSGRPCASSSSLYSLFFRKEPEAKNWARTLAAAACRRQQALSKPTFLGLFDK